MDFANRNTVPGELKFGEPLDDAGVVGYFRECLGRAKPFFDKIWEENDTFYDAYWGDTLSEGDKYWLELTKRPGCAFNVARSTIDAVVGSDQADRKEVVWRGVGEESSDDHLRGGLFTSLNRFFMNRGRGYAHEGDALFDLAIGGYGFAETRININARPMVVETCAVPPREMYPDPDSIEDNMTDARFMIRRKNWTLEQVVARWPDSEDEIKTGVAAGRVITSTPRFVPNKGNMTARVPFSQKSSRDHVEIYDFCYLRQIPAVVWIDPETGKEVDGTKAEFVAAQSKQMTAFSAQQQAWEQVRDEIEQQALLGEGISDPGPEPVAPPPLQVVLRYAKDCWYRAFVLGGENVPTVANASNVVLEHKKLPIHQCPYSVATGYKKKQKDGTVRRFGIMKGIYEPQMYMNRALLTILDLMGRQAKGGGYIEQDAMVGSLADFVKNESTPGNWTVVKPGAISAQKILPKTTSAFSENIARFVQFLADFLPQISSVNDYLKGAATSERSNVLVSNMQASAMNALNPFMEQFTTFRMEAGKARIEMSLEMPDDVIDKILDLRPEALEGITYTVDPNTGQPAPGKWPSLAAFLRDGGDPQRYDVAVDIGQASPTSRQQVWGVLGQGIFKEIAELLKEAGVDLKPVGKVLMKNLPLPGLQASELEKEMEKSFAQAELLQTTEGIIQVLSQMAPEEQQSIAAQISQMAEQAAMQQQQQMPQGQPVQ